jgi:adenylosuccinate lyase
MNKPTLMAISPIDGRYAEKVNDLRETFSEYGLIRYRVLIEVRWLQCLHNETTVPELSAITPAIMDKLNQIIDDFSIEDAQTVKDIELTTNHDVKAIEYFIRKKLGNKPDTETLKDFLHFACTSEDINNLSYALMMRAARSDILIPIMDDLRDKLKNLAITNANLAMISRTHGQIASPTTLGKEITNIIVRIDRAQKQFLAVDILGKFNGAVGNYNAHTAAYPDNDWLTITSEFIKSLALKPNLHTTQIEPHDWIAEYCHALMRYNTILIDLSRDVWGYISLGYFKQKVLKNEIGSSTMPHKVNPIDFENAEGNFGIANAMLAHFSEKLPISRWQRDLTDSTVQRNLGSAISHVLIAQIT